MNRIFASLAVFALLALATNFLIGLSIGDYNAEVSLWRDQLAEVRTLERRRPAPPAAEIEAARAKLVQLNTAREPQMKRVRLHWHIGLSAAIVTILVNSITVTYFVGTSRWCKEVCDAYQLDSFASDECTRLKRRTFPWAVIGMLTMVGLAALGAASEPGNSMVSQPGQWVIWHFTGACVALGIVGWSFTLQAINVQKNYRLIQTVMDQVRQIRTDRGLETN